MRHYRKSSLSYRILERQKKVHDKQGIPHKVRQFYLQVAVENKPAVITSRRGTGAIGVDLNIDHFAIGEIDRSGNPVRAFTLPTVMEGKSSGQITAMFGNHIRDIVAYAKLKSQPIAVEALDFQKKKSALRETHGRKMARMLSGFAYKKFIAMITSRCASEGVKLFMVNPAFSSVLGAYNYFGLRHLYSGHQMAAFVLARRGLGFQDSLKCTYKERNHTALLRTVSIAPEKAPPTFDNWIKSGGKRHRWSLLRRYYRTYFLFVKHLGSGGRKARLYGSREQRSIFPFGPPELRISPA
jgi:IS605 OrfB family transposase